MIEIFVNNKPRRISANDTSLGQLLQLIRLTEHRGLAIAVNDEVIPKDRWDTCQLHRADRILIITASQGG